MISRRNFLKGNLLLGVGAILNGKLSLKYSQTDGTGNFEYFGRVFAKAEIMSKPSPDSTNVGVYYNDNVVPWYREVVGEPISIYTTNRKWVETPDGFIPAATVQKVKNIENSIVDTLPMTSDGEGFWAEVSVPYIDLTLANPPARAPLLKENANMRFYYSQVFWVNGILDGSDGKKKYHIVEKYGSYGDEFIVDASALRQIREEELSLISPDVSEKRILIDVSHQTLAAFENDREVYFCRISSGAKYNSEGSSVQKWATPLGDNHVINRKYASLHMAGGSRASGYELFGVSWTSIFASGGVAIHSTYWHNNYGEPMSHGCVNAEPDDAKFIFRWSQPTAPADTGYVEVQGYSGTKVQVVEG